MDRNGHHELETREGVKLALLAKAVYASRNSRNSKPPESPLAFLFEDFRQKLNHLLPRPDSSRPAPSATQSGQSVALQRQRAIFRAVGGVLQDVGGTRDALEGLNWPHFRFWSLISIFECHVCATGGSGPLTGRAATTSVER